MNENKMKLEDLSTVAVQKGAKDAKIIDIDQISVADWVYWKCRYGCPSYGKTLTCPPHSPNPNQTRALLKGYKHALLLKYDSSQDYHQLLLELEREAFLRGFYKAWSLTAGGCRLCEKCDPNEKCIHPGQARPSMEACGIDVFATNKNAGFEMKVLTSKDMNYPRNCLLLVR
jgi:predicted metal-binding protein